MVRSRMGRSTYTNIFVLTTAALVAALIGTYLYWDSLRVREQPILETKFVIVAVELFVWLVIVTYASVLRLHDTNRSATWLLFILISWPLFFLILCLAPGTVGPNRYGEEPT